MGRPIDKNSDTQRIKSLRVGRKLTFPIERRNSIKALVAARAVEWNQEYETISNIEERTITVKRIK